MERRHQHLTESIVGAAIEVHRALGAGLLEAAYTACLCSELTSRGHSVAREVAVPLRYKGREIAVGYRMDVLVDDAVVLEIKALDHLLPVHTAQLLTYMRMSDRDVGLLLNFNVVLLKDGIRRCYRPGQHPSRDPAPV